MAEHNEPETRLFLHGKPVHDHIECHEHISPPSLYVKILLALFALTILTYLVSFADLGQASLPVAMIVAVVKASLVIMFFMHLKYDERYHVFIFLSSLLFVSIFFTFTIFDLTSRPRLNEQQETFFRVRRDGDWNDRTHLRTPPPPPPAGDDEAHPPPEGVESEAKAEAEAVDSKSLH